MLADIKQRISDVYRNESRRAFATLVRLLGDFDLAEEMLHEAFAVVLQKQSAQFQVTIVAADVGPKRVGDV